MNKLELENDILEGLSSRQIAKKYNKSRSTIQYWIEKYELSTQFKSNKILYSEYEHIKWDDFQKLYDSGMSFDDMKNAGFTVRSILWAIKTKKIKLRTKSQSAKLEQKRNKRSLSNNTKQKISAGRIKYLMANPDKVPYKINHSSKKSYPEQIFENALISSGINGWTYAFQNGIYEYDFAFINQKIDVEIDGGTHLSEKVKKIDERRDNFSKSQGWIILRFTANEVKQDVISCINKLKEILNRSMV